MINAERLQETLGSLDRLGITPELSRLDGGLGVYDKCKGITSVDGDAPGFDSIAFEGDMQLCGAVFD